MSDNPSAPPSILLVGFQDQDNLGLRYLMSSVRQAGFAARIVTYQTNPDPLVAVACREQPTLIGFSLIFQYMAPDFARVIQALRAAGVRSHITMGGHYPSFDYAEVLQRIPDLDSIVRFEGEQTLIELMQRIEAHEDWHEVQGLAFRQGDTICATPLRPALRDLDQIPPPVRDDIDYHSQAFPTASVLGSRGCPWACTFCSIRPFYEAQQGPLRRLRAPERVVEEIVAIYQQHHVSVFLFQDDDFLAGGPRAQQWAGQIASGLAAAGLTGKVAFKVSCRSDEIHEATMQQLMAGGLTHVYMGVENGDPTGLINMNKRIKPEQHHRAGRILKALGLSFDFGFMLLDPYSTFAMVRNNIDFLEAFVGDGWSVASFCRMLPYAGTPIKKQLEQEGRLLGTPFEPDYRFLDPKLDLFYDWMLDTFHERNFTNRGLCHILKSLLFEARLRLPQQQMFSDAERAYTQHLTAICNGLAIYTLRAAVDYIEATPLSQLKQDPSFLQRLTQCELEEEQRLMHEVVNHYWSVHKRHHQAPPTTPLPMMGGFEKAWTLADGDLAQIPK